jgi:hypothetical protein
MNAFTYRINWRSWSWTGSARISINNQIQYPEQSIITLDPKASVPLPPQSEQQPKETETYHQSLEATKKRPEPNPLSDKCYLTIC